MPEPESQSTSPSAEPPAQSATLASAPSAAPAAAPSGGVGSRYWLVLVLSVLLGGWIGEILNGQWRKGVTALLVSAMVVIPTCGVGWVLIHIITACDAILQAGRIARGETVGEWEWF